MSSSASAGAFGVAAGTGAPSLPTLIFAIDHRPILAHACEERGVREAAKRIGEFTRLAVDAVLAARAAGADEQQLAPALELQRRAQWRVDFIAAENSMGFHAPQESARLLAEAADMARQGVAVALRWDAPVSASAPTSETAPTDGR
jgi:hypothetical protein